MLPHEQNQLNMSNVQSMLANHSISKCASVITFERVFLRTNITKVFPSPPLSLSLFSNSFFTCYTTYQVSSRLICPHQIRKRDASAFAMKKNNVQVPSITLDERERKMIKHGIICQEMYILTILCLHYINHII